MGMDLDFLAGQAVIEMLQELLNNQEHGEREELANDIIEFVAKMKEKYPAK